MVARTDARGKALNATAETIHLQDTIIITIVAWWLLGWDKGGIKQANGQGELLAYAHAM